MAGPQELVLLDRARRVLAQAQTVDQIRDVRDRAQAVRAYVRKARLSRKLVIDAAILRIQAERKLGQVLKKLPLAKGAPGNQYTLKKAARPAHTVRSLSSGGGPVYLRDLGLTESDSSRAQRIAGLPDDVFENFLSAARDTGHEPSVAALLRLVKELSTTKTVASPTKDTSVTQRSSTVNALVSENRHFGSLYTKPYWPKGRSRTSNTMQRIFSQLQDEPIAKLAMPNSHLHVHTPSLFLPDSLNLVEAWGFAYVTCLVVSKPTKSDALDFLLTCTRGQTAVAESLTGVIESDREHTFAMLRQRIERASPGPFLALHGDDTEAPGWTVCR
jgi:hypothetical protein